jgi:hypothetical protein
LGKFHLLAARLVVVAIVIHILFCKLGAMPFTFLSYCGGRVKFDVEGFVTRITSDPNLVAQGDDDEYILDEAMERQVHIDDTEQSPAIGDDVNEQSADKENVSTAVNGHACCRESHFSPLTIHFLQFASHFSATTFTALVTTHSSRLTAHFSRVTAHY